MLGSNHLLKQTKEKKTESKKRGAMGHPQALTLVLLGYFLG
jgi:hypothetical protein